MRGWVSKDDHTWVMYCDGPDCRVTVPARNDRESLRELAEAGWFIAALSGDLCPTCRSLYGSTWGSKPNQVMAESTGRPVELRPVEKAVPAAGGSAS